MTHTQGPWRATGSTIRSDNHIDGTGALLLLPGPMFHDYTPDPEEQNANLTLAAAAPELLAALRQMMEWEGGEPGKYIDYDDEQRANEVWQDAEAAIAKATKEGSDA